MKKTLALAAVAVALCFSAQAQEGKMMKKEAKAEGKMTKEAGKDMKDHGMKREGKAVKKAGKEMKDDKMKVKEQM